MKQSSRTALKAGALTASAACSLALLALANRYAAKKAQSDNPAAGEFVEIEGVQLHYIRRGAGRPIVFLHGNGSMIEDFESSGVLTSIAGKFRILAFDRPGYGHSSRPNNKIWTPEEQAALIAKALTILGVESAIIVGHSWGTLVATALALQHPEKVTGLVLASGYYFPTARRDAVFGSAGAIPGLGRVLCYTILPLIGRLAWPALIRKLFSPRNVPIKFRGFSKEMALRPSQLRASAQEAALMVPSTQGLADACARLTIPVAVVCGAGDQIVDPHQSVNLHRILKDSTLSTLLFNGHMVHHTALEQVATAIEELAHRSDNLVQGIG